MGKRKPTESQTGKNPAKRQAKRQAKSAETAPAAGQPEADQVQNIVAAVVPAVTQSVLQTLKDMGILPPAPPAQIQASGPASPDVATITEPSASSTTQVPGTSGISQLAMVSPIAGKNPGGGATTIARQLGLGLDPKIRGKIWAGEFVDFAVLIGSGDGESLEGDKMEMVEGPNNSYVFKKVPNTKAIRSMNQWLRAFHMFVSIYTSKFPSATPELMKYADTIQSLARRAGDMAALSYDKRFRMLKESLGQELSFGSVDIEGYNEALAMGLCAKLRPQQSPFPTKGSAKKHCYAYNNGNCSKQGCSFSHTCQKCGGRHTKKQCRSSAAPTTTSSSQSGANKPKPKSGFQQ